MGKMTPTLGYPSRTHAIHALHAQGETTVEIACRLGMKPGQVTDYLNNTGPRELRGVLDATAAGRVEHRPTGDGAVRELVLRLPERRYASLVSAAIKARATPGAHALSLLDRGWSAAPGEEPAGGGDAALAEVEARVERLQSRLAAREARIAELEGELARAGEDAAVSVDPETAARAEALAALVAELEEAMKGAAVAANHAGALLRERDDRIALLEEAQGRACAAAAALQEQVKELKAALAGREAEVEHLTAAVVSGHQHTLKLERERDEADIRSSGLRVALQERDARIAEWRGKAQAHAERADQWQGEAQQLEAELRLTRTALEMTEKDKAELKGAVALAQSRAAIFQSRAAIPEATAILEPATAALTPGQLRLAQGLRAAGNTPAEIAAQIGAPVGIVRKALS